jgi:hypothetical protein
MGHLGFRLGRVLLVRIWTWSRLPNVSLGASVRA